MKGGLRRFTPQDDVADVLTRAARADTLSTERRWGASCPRQGNRPTQCTTRQVAVRPFSCLRSADVRRHGGRIMSDMLPPRRSLESLRKEAKRWLSALRRGDSDARARFTHAHPQPSGDPTLRDVQLALAREHGFEGWNALIEAIERPVNARAIAYYERAAAALLEAYRTGTPEAMEAHYALTWHRRPWRGMRTYVQLDLGKRPVNDGDDVPIALDDARYLVAVEHGYRNWDDLRQRVAAPPSHGDDRLAQLIAGVAPISLDLSGLKTLDDDGIRQLAALDSLENLNLSGTAITDRALETIATLPNLRSLSLAMTHVTDDGIARLARCRGLEEVDLSWTRTGDAALRTLAGFERLRQLRTGSLVTDAGLPLLHQIPAFKTWLGGESQMSLLGYRASPNQLVLRGRITDRGMQALRGLDGLFSLDIDDSALGLSAAAVEPLISLPNLGWLACDARDDWMSSIAVIPRLRFLSAQDTVAGDDGFEALSASMTLEYLWGRRCHNLQRRGFVALSRIPTLRGLSVSCLNVDDVGVASLPDFPSLRELMPMDIPDAGYRHIGKCGHLESLILMYCRDTTDAATEQITELDRLTHYFNSYTTITDRTPALLSAMGSLERVTLDACHWITDAGVAALERLPRLRELHATGRGLTHPVSIMK